MPMRTVTVNQIQKLDEMAIEKYGVPSIVLMENAGRSVAEEVIKQVKRAKNPFICVICGLGNNAGDGFVAARHLLDSGIKTIVYLIGKSSRLKHDAAVNYKILKKLKYPVKEIAAISPSFVKDVKSAEIVVDAIFGVGLNREILEPFRGVIEAINNHAKRIIAADIPSGLDGTTGKIYGICVKADVTVTFSLIKKGFLKNEGPRHTGKIIIAEIGIPKKIILK